MKARIAWPVLAMLPALTPALGRAAKAADDEVVIGFALAGSGWMNPLPRQPDTVSLPSSGRRCPGSPPSRRVVLPVRTNTVTTPRI
jgi:hypothetical protein